MAVAGSSPSRTAPGPAVLGGAAALAVTAVCLWSMWSWLHTTAAVERSLDQSARVAVLLLGAGALSLMWGRRAPVAVLAATGLALVVHGLVADVSTPLPLALLIALCAVAGACPRSVATGSGVALAVFVAVGVLVDDAGEDEFVDFVLLTVVAWMLGSGNRVARARTRALEQETLLVRGEHEAKTALALEQERARIARELHDVVAHSVCVMVAQARAGQRLVDHDPGAARETLQAVEGTGREALTELRRLLDLLRPAEEEPAVAPQPGLDQLPALVAQVQGTGLPVVLEVQGTPRRLPAGLELNAYRIVQESLTNALKHGSRTRTRVVLTYGEDVLEVRVEDLGSTPCAAAGGSGRGLMGMRQRAALVGGRLQAGPRGGGGFTVTAQLPTDLAA